ncbi:16072_t:CDS:2, partial [Gigaspora rosea]
YKKKSLIVKNTIEKANRPKYSRNYHPEYCFCNICKSILVDPRTKKSHIARRDIVVRNFLDVGGSSTTIIDLLEILFPEMEFPDMEISDNPIQFDTSKKGKKSGKWGKWSVSLPMEFSKTFFSDDENDEAGLNENLSEDEEDLDNNEINFNAPDSYKENDNPAEPADTTNASMWIVFWALNYQAEYIIRY